MSRIALLRLRDDCNYILAESYTSELQELKKAKADLKTAGSNDVIGPATSKALSEGDPIKKETHAIRQRKLRLIQAIQRAGYDDEAHELKSAYTVADRNVVFSPDVCDFIWTMSD